MLRMCRTVHNYAWGATHGICVLVVLQSNMVETSHRKSQLHQGPDDL